MSNEYDLIPDKINEKPTIWLGLTMGELTRIGVASFLLCLFVVEIIFMVLFGGVKGFFYGVFVASMVAGIAFYVFAKRIAAKRQGKPYGYADAKFQHSPFRFLGFQFGKVPCINRRGIWINRKIKYWQ